MANLNPIRAVIQQQQMTFLAAARALHISTQHLNYLMTSRRRPSPALAQKLVTLSGGILKFEDLLLAPVHRHGPAKPARRQRKTSNGTTR